MLNAAHRFQIDTDWHLRMPPDVEGVRR